MNKRKDSEDLDEFNNECEDSKAGSFIRSSIFAFILFLAVSSDIFVETILRHIPHAMEGKDITFFGTIVHAIIFALAWSFLVYSCI